jgi:hypothetical protein
MKKTPNPKSQIPNKAQIPNLDRGIAAAPQRFRHLQFSWNLGFGAWDLFGIWDLEFGISF